jgi:hypothetical protein
MTWSVVFGPKRGAKAVAALSLVKQRLLRPELGVLADEAALSTAKDMR